MVIETNCNPIYIRQYPISEAYKPVVDKQVQKWFDNGVITYTPADLGVYAVLSPLITVGI